MTPEEHRGLRESLGAFALGHLGPEETAAVGRHVAACPACRADLDEIASLADSLRSVDWHRLADVSAPPPELGERIVAAVAAERRREDSRRNARRLTAAFAAAAALVAAVGVGTVAGHANAPRTVAAPPGPFEPVAVRTNVPGIDATAGVVPHTWGVEIKLRAAGFEPGATYAVFVRTADGRRRSAGAFVGTGAKTMNCNLNSDVLRPDAASFDVVDAAGRTVLAATLPVA